MINNKTHKLILYNDDIHDYGYVIACLIRICQHDPIQAEQCVIIADNKGKCVIKQGDILNMIEMKTSLEELELITEIENYESHMY